MLFSEWTDQGCQNQATLGHLFLYAYLSCMTLSNTHASAHRFSKSGILLHVALHDWIEQRCNSWASALQTAVPPFKCCWQPCVTYWEWIDPIQSKDCIIVY